MAEVKIDRTKYPPNNGKKEGQDVSEKKPLEKVITGNVKKVKKGWLDSVADFFFGEDAQSVGNFVLHDIIIPAAKNVANDAITGAVEMMLYGDTKRSRGKGRDDRDTVVSYTSYYGRTGRERSRDIRPKFDFGNIQVDSRIEAVNILDGLQEQIDQYEEATVGDLYELIGEEPDYTDEKYGWKTLKRAEILTVRNGFIVSLPNPIVLEK